MGVRLCPSPRPGRRSSAHSMGAKRSLFSARRRRRFAPFNSRLPLGDDPEGRSSTDVGATGSREPPYLGIPYRGEFLTFTRPRTISIHVMVSPHFPPCEFPARPMPKPQSPGVAKLNAYCTHSSHPPAPSLPRQAFIPWDAPLVHFTRPPQARRDAPPPAHA